jgi:hypothetical protein
MGLEGRLRAVAGWWAKRSRGMTEFQTAGIEARGALIRKVADGLLRQLLELMLLETHAFTDENSIILSQSLASAVLR